MFDRRLSNLQRADLAGIADILAKHVRRTGDSGDGESAPEAAEGRLLKIIELLRCKTPYDLRTANPGRRSYRRASNSRLVRARFATFHLLVQA